MVRRDGDAAVSGVQTYESRATVACDCGRSFIDGKMGAPRRLQGYESELERQSARHASPGSALAQQALLVPVLGSGARLTAFRAAATDSNGRANALTSAALLNAQI